MRRIGLFFIWLAVVALGADLLFSLETKTMSFVRLNQLATIISPYHGLPQQLNAVPSVLPAIILGLALLVWGNYRQGSRYGYQRRRRPSGR